MKRGTFIVIALAACTPQPPPDDPDFDGPRYQTEYAEVRTNFLPRLCPAELERIDHTVERLAEVFDVEAPDQLVIRLTDSFPPPSCSPGTTGCFNEPVVTTMERSLEHELVHAVTEPLGIEALFWREGLAEAYGGSMLVPGQASVSASLTAERGSLDYRTAGHFVRWLIEEQGLETFLNAVEAGDLGAVYGQGLEELEDRYLDEAPWSYPGDGCEGTRLEFEGVELTYDATLSCDDPDASRAGEPFPFARHLGVARVLEVAEPGTFRFGLRGGHCVFINGCSDEVREQEPELTDPATGAPDGYMESGDEADYWLEPGSYRVVMYASAHSDEENVQLTVRRIDD